MDYAYYSGPHVRRASGTIACLRYACSLNLLLRPVHSWYRCALLFKGFAEGYGFGPSLVARTPLPPIVQTTGCSATARLSASTTFLPPSFCYGLNPGTLGDHVSQGLLSPTYMLGGRKIESEEIPSPVNSIDGQHFDTYIGNTFIIFDCSSKYRKFGAYTLPRYQNGLFRASSMGLPYPQSNFFCAHEPCVP